MPVGVENGKPKDFSAPVISAFNLAVIADQPQTLHPANSPAMAVPETLVHPFATAKLVVWPGTCSVRSRHIIAARSRNACADTTLCACGRSSERTGNHCDHNEGNKCLLQSGPPANRLRSTRLIRESSRWSSSAILL